MYAALPMSQGICRSPASRCVQAVDASRHPRTGFMPMLMLQMENPEMMCSTAAVGVVDWQPLRCRRVGWAGASVYHFTGCVGRAGRVQSGKDKKTGFFAHLFIGQEAGIRVFRYCALLVEALFCRRAF